ncbi:MAG: cyclic nucleotide-binding domain-containing protein [Gammaproteobacteria bacterium]|nr:cyclic nucleotide-binding domain-containing protein [Gammaproteobacteria bacterium]
MSESSFFKDLTAPDISEIKSYALVETFQPGELVFAEGDTVDSFYIIESGQVSIFVDKCGKDESICVLQKDDYFGEMAIFNKDKRTASARANSDTVLLSIDKERFLNFVKTHPMLAEKINLILIQRDEELLLRETLIGSTGINSEKLQVSIKGDPSLRESAFTRERYESVVDKLLPELEPNLEDLLLNRCIYRIFINFNSGEVRTSSIFDPYNEEIHTANKLISKAYVERHFPKISYQEKSAFVERMFSFVGKDELFSQLSPGIQKLFNESHNDWQPVEREEISRVMRQLSTLRSIQSFYLRNFSISMIQDAIRMQFNCDGTHFVNAEQYQRFLQDNLETDQV